MTDWKVYAVAMSESILKYDKNKEAEERQHFTELAHEVKNLLESENEVQSSYIKWWRAQKRKEAEKYFVAYLDEARKHNEYAQKRLDRLLKPSSGSQD